MKLPVGKFKDLEIDEIQDISYLRWAEENLNLGNAQLKEVRDQISNLQNGTTAKKKWATEESVKKSADYIIGKIRDIDYTEVNPKDMAVKAVKEMYRMLTGKDHVG